MSDQRVSLIMGILQNVVHSLGKGDFILFDKILLPTIKFPKRRFKRSLTYPCPRKKKSIYVFAIPLQDL